MANPNNIQITLPNSTQPQTATPSAPEVFEIPPGYQLQDLPKKYLKSAVLKAYIRTRPEEFGNDPRFEAKRDTHRIAVKRHLREDEIIELQRESFPAYASNTEWV